MILEKMHSVLLCYYEATLCNEGKDDHLGRWFSTMEYIFAKTWDAVVEFRGLKRENPRCSEYVCLEAAANSAWLKCEQYYMRADESAAYYAAEVLQPSRKWNWLRQQWEDDEEKRPWLDAAKKAVQELWEQEYKGKFGAPKSATQPVTRPQGPNEEFGSLSEYRKIKTLKPTTSDPYQAYIDRDPEGDAEDDPLDYWNARISSQPDLARFAIDMLALPVSSTECERVFSSAKLLITASRNRLRPDIIEANECLKAWFGKPQQVEQDEHGGQDVDWASSKESGEKSGEESGEESGGESSDAESDQENDDGIDEESDDDE
jgi:hypothetical protein